MRQLKHHEKKLLRKVSLYSWKGEDNLRVAKIMRKYHLQNREDYVSYNRIVGMVTKLTAKLKVCACVCMRWYQCCLQVCWKERERERETLRICWITTVSLCYWCPCEGSSTIQRCRSHTTQGKTKSTLHGPINRPIHPSMHRSIDPSIVVIPSTLVLTPNNPTNINTNINTNTTYCCRLSHQTIRFGLP